MQRLPIMRSNRFIQRWHLPLIIGMSLIVILVYCAYVKTRADATVKLIIYAYSTQEEVLNLGIAPAFQKAWKAETGQEVDIEMVFGPSGTMAGHILLGAPADLAIFSSEDHISLLKHGDLLRSDNTPAYHASTPMVIITRPGNPLAITSFPDLAKPGIKLLHADPRISVFTASLHRRFVIPNVTTSGDSQAAADQLKEIWDNVTIMENSARSTLGLFTLGVGDAMITYEQDAYLGIQRGLPIEVVIPERTIIAQHVAVLVDDNLRMSERPAAEALLQFIQGETGQKIYQDFHCLSAQDVQTKENLDRVKYFSVQDLGGWDIAERELFDKLWGGEIYPQLSFQEQPVLFKHPVNHE